MNEEKEKIIADLTNYLATSRDNYMDFVGGAGYETPIFGFASAKNPLFEEYKTIVDKQHLTPTEIYNRVYPDEPFPNGTVISVALPLAESIVKSNRKATPWPSKEWTVARTLLDEVLREKTLTFLISIIEGMGYNAVSPIRQDFFRRFLTSKGQPCSVWSERHAAYACGLGTFSLTDAMITEKGSAVRFISVITDLIIEPDISNTKDYMGNCLFFSKGTCKVCIKRCPVGAITEEGHDKMKCYHYLYGEESQKKAADLGVSPAAGSGCGLCQTGVPCERRNPNRLP